MRQREDVVEVTHLQKLGLPGREPLGGRQLLALGAVAIAARVIKGPAMAAAVALFDVAAQRRRAADFDVAHDLGLHPRQRMPPAVVGAVKLENVGHAMLG